MQFDDFFSSFFLLVFFGGGWWHHRRVLLVLFCKGGWFCRSQLFCLVFDFVFLLFRPNYFVFFLFSIFRFQTGLFFFRFFVSFVLNCCSMCVVLFFLMCCFFLSVVVVFSFPLKSLFPNKSPITLRIFASTL